MCAIKEKYGIFDEFWGFCGQFVGKLGRKDPLIFCLKEDIYVSHNIIMLKLDKSMEYFFFYVTFCCKKHDI